MRTYLCVIIHEKIETMKFSNAANKKLAQFKRANLIHYNHNGESLRGLAIEAHEQGKIVYYENVKPTKQYPNGSSYLHEIVEWK